MKSNIARILVYAVFEIICVFFSKNAAAIFAFIVLIAEIVYSCIKDDNTDDTKE